MEQGRWRPSVAPCDVSEHAVRQGIQPWLPTEQTVMYPQWYKNVSQSLFLYLKTYIYLQLGKP